jgi:hypothetical protein
MRNLFFGRGRTKGFVRRLRNTKHPLRGGVGGSGLLRTCARGVCARRLAAALRGATEKKTRENDVHLRQLAKKSTYVPSFFFLFFLVRFWAFLGKGVRKHEKKN